MSRFEELRYNVEFVTPAFLGSAGDGQVAQWRTPPFKALLREWWRIGQAKKFNYDYEKMLKEERYLFGNAVSANDSHQSLIKLRLENWEFGKARYPAAEFGKYKVQTAFNPPRTTPAGLYLGYGPVQLDEKQSRIALEASSKNVLSVVIPTQEDALKTQILVAMQLASWFGTIGSRARNSWGSVSLTPADPEQPTLPFETKYLKDFVQDYEAALELDWPHAIGKDRKGVLIWMTKPSQDWKMVMKDLAELRIRVRKKCIAVRGLPGLQEKHILAYPLKEPLVANWGASERMANQLRLKVVRNGDKYQGLVVHIPHRVPEPLASKLLATDQNKLGQMQLDVWTKVHSVLDAEIAEGGLNRL
jgi:CRISPR-associated protein Cmr1